MNKKDRLLVIFLFIFSIFVSSGISVYATSTYLFNSSDVSYSNTNSKLVSANVQDALDELYQHSTDYTEINTRVDELENPFKLEFTGVGDSFNHGGYIDFHYNGSSSDYTSRIIESSDGVINLQASNGVRINGVNAGKEIKYKDVRLENITIPSNGYYSISSSKPSGMTNFLFASLWDFGKAADVIADFDVSGNGNYIRGSANTRLNYLIIRYFYTD